MAVFADMARSLTLVWAGLFATAGVVSLFVPSLARLAIGAVLSVLGLASPKAGEWYIRRRLAGHQPEAERV